MCGSGCYAFERTNHMPRNMVIGKLKYWIEPQPEHTFPPSLNVVSHAATCGCKKAHDPAPYRGVDSCSRGCWACSVHRELKGKVAWAKRDVDPHACVLGLPGQVNKFDSNRPLLTVWDCFSRFSRFGTASHGLGLLLTVL